MSIRFLDENICQDLICEASTVDAKSTFFARKKYRTLFDNTNIVKPTFFNML
jgi:hypothetical protein